MNYLEKLLIIPEKIDKERDKVAKVWESLGGEVLKLDRFWEKPIHFLDKPIAIYGNDTFALVVAQVFNVNLIAVKDIEIKNLDKAYTKRTIKVKNLAHITAQDFPNFFKPAVPKQFKAKVYENYTIFQEEVQGLSDETQVIISEIITIEAEVRSFILEKQIKDIALYEGEASLAEAEAFLKIFLQQNAISLPKTFVIDLGYNHQNGWFIIEFNSSWGAGLNGCNPAKVIYAIIEATEN